MRFIQADRSKIEDPEAWLVAVALRVCYQVLRDRYKRQHADFDDSAATAAQQDQSDQVLNATWFLQVVQHLPDVDRNVLTWLYVDRLTRAEMAARLGVSTDYLRVIVLRARRRAQSVMASLDRGIGL